MNKKWIIPIPEKAIIDVDDQAYLEYEVDFDDKQYNWLKIVEKNKIEAIFLPEYREGNHKIKI